MNGTNIFIYWLSPWILFVEVIFFINDSVYLMLYLNLFISPVIYIVILYWSQLLKTRCSQSFQPSYNILMVVMNYMMCSYRLSQNLQMLALEVSAVILGYFYEKYRNWILLCEHAWNEQFHKYFQSFLKETVSCI